MVSAARAASRRAQQRGAAIFIVVLVFTLLTALGLYAVRSTSLAELAAGYNRQYTQTHFVGDYAAFTLSSALGINPFMHSQNMERLCTSNCCVGYSNQQLANQKPTCAQYSRNDLQLLINGYFGNVVFNGDDILNPSTDTAPGSLGPAADFLEGDMKIELTDKHPAWPPVRGNQTNTVGGGALLGYVMVTISANGLTRPRQLNAGTWDLRSATAAGTEMSRANVIMGPVPQ